MLLHRRVKRATCVQRASDHTSILDPHGDLHSIVEFDTLTVANRADLIVQSGYQKAHRFISNVSIHGGDERYMSALTSEVRRCASSGYKDLRHYSTVVPDNKSQQSRHRIDRLCGTGNTCRSMEPMHQEPGFSAPGSVDSVVD